MKGVSGGKSHRDVDGRENTIKKSTYGSAGDDQLDLAVVGAHELGELDAHTVEDTEPVVLGKGLEEVLDHVRLVGGADALVQLRHDLLLVLGVEGGRGDDGLELSILLEEVAERVERLGRRLEGGRLCGGGVLCSIKGCEGLNWRRGRVPDVSLQECVRP